MTYRALELATEIVMLKDYIRNCSANVNAILQTILSYVQVSYQKLNAV